MGYKILHVPTSQYIDVETLTSRGRIEEFIYFLNHQDDKEISTWFNYLSNYGIFRGFLPEEFEIMEVKEI